MISRHSRNFLRTFTALAFFAAPLVWGQARKHVRRARTAPAAKSAAPQPAAPAPEALNLGFGVPESLSGKIQMVVADQNLVVVNGPNGVPYDLKVTPKTLIVAGEKRVTIDSLTKLAGQSVSVGFVPQRDGNVATRIETSD